jgi:hypothetical protein
MHERGREELRCVGVTKEKESRTESTMGFNAIAGFFNLCLLFIVVDVDVRHSCQYNDALVAWQWRGEERRGEERRGEERRSTIPTYRIEQQARLKPCNIPQERTTAAFTDSAVCYYAR